MGKKRGRPKKENGRNKTINIRLTEKERKMLDRMVDKTGLTATQIVIRGIRLYNLLIKLVY